MTLPPLLAIALCIACAGFALTWAISIKINNYGLLDVAWSYGIAVLAPIYSFFSPGFVPRKWLMTAIGLAWSVRLGTYILLRVLSHHPREDVRYETLRERWPGPAMFLLFFEIQALLVVLLSLPFLFVAFDPRPAFTPVEIFGLALGLVAVCGESLADFQMQRFKANPENSGKVCQAGLWRYSRHPNYFFESLVWWAFFLAALDSGFGWLTVVCPLLMLYFLLRVTGIRLTEEYSLKSKGDVYRQYQQTTSMFVPWFRRERSRP